LICHITALVELSAILPDALFPIAPVVVEALQIFVILEMTGVLDHVFAVLLRSLDAGNEAELVQILRQAADRKNARGICHQHCRVQLFDVRVR